MSSYLQILGFALIPAFGNMLGGVAGEYLKFNRSIFRFVLHLAVGIVLGVIAVEIFPRVLQARLPWIIFLAFFLGGCFTIGTDIGVGKLVKRLSRGKNESSTGPWMIYFAAAVDLFSDGIMIGTGGSISTGLGILLALGQVPADIPEGFAVASSFKGVVQKRSKRLLLIASFFIPILAGASLGFWGVRGQGDLLKYSLLAFTAGALLNVAVESMLTEAHQRKEEEEEAPIYALMLNAGVVLFGLLAVYLGK